MIGNPTEPQDGIECDDTLMDRVGRGDEGSL